MEIVETDYGISSNYGDVVEINRKLEGKLREKIIKHELRHSKGAYDRNDFKNDFQSIDKHPYFLDTVKFCFKNPEGWINYFFVMYSYYFKAITFNTTALFPFFLWGLIFSGMSFLFFKINLLNSFLMWCCVYIVLNFLALVYTHFYVSKVNRIVKPLS